MAQPTHTRSLAIAQFAVGVAGFCCFINLYSPQAVLPLLSGEFGASAAEVSHIITVSTLAVAITAPFTGAVADVLGRKRVIVAALFVLAVPTLMMALSTSLSQMIFWRAVQGLVLPPIFAVTLAYIGDEWPPAGATRAAGIYSSGSSFGGFSGRLVVGIVADLVGWRYGFGALAVMTLLGAIAVALLLPHEKHFIRSEGLIASGKQMLAHLRNGQLLATYAVGFGVLFIFIATFTYVSFHLAAPPYNLSASALGLLFVVYLAGSVLTPWTGWAVARFGRRRFTIRIICIWAVGIALTLLPSLIAIIAGLAICAAAGLICQAVSTGYVTVTAKAGRSSAVGLYVTSFYLGGSVGAAAGGLAWTYGKWPLCVGMVLAMLTVMISIVTFLWARRVPPGPPSLPMEAA
jgi:MFS transporter, YNFM family, putative membrane transport protein